MTHNGAKIIFDPDERLKKIFDEQEPFTLNSNRSTPLTHYHFRTRVNNLTKIYFLGQNFFHQTQLLPQLVPQQNFLKAVYLIPVIFPICPSQEPSEFPPLFVSYLQNYFNLQNKNKLTLAPDYLDCNLFRLLSDDNTVFQELVPSVPSRLRRIARLDET